MFSLLKEALCIKQLKPVLNHGLMASKEFRAFCINVLFFCPCTSLYSDNDFVKTVNISKLVKYHYIVLLICLLDFNKMRLLFCIFQE